MSDEIPKGPTGKLQRFVGTERYRNGAFEDTLTSGMTTDTDPTELSRNQEILMEIWKDILDIESLSPEDDFFRCGGNSLTAIELLIRMQRAFHLTLAPDTVYQYPTIRQQELVIAQKMANE